MPIYSLGKRQLSLLSVVPVCAWALDAMDQKESKKEQRRRVKDARSYYARCDIKRVEIQNNRQLKHHVTCTERMYREIQRLKEMGRERE